MSMVMLVALIPAEDQTSISLPESVQYAITNLRAPLDAQYVLNCAMVVTDALCKRNDIKAAGE